MGIFNNNLEIDLENPFKNDKLQREAEVKSLTALFEVIDNQMVLAVNSEWGTGKTSFLRMWNQYLKKKEYKTVFFNAWENDFVDDPFIAFVNEINNSLNSESKTKGFLEKAKDAGLALIKQSPQIVSTIVKNKTGLDSEDFISNDDIKQLISDKIDNYNDNKNTIDIFKKELTVISNSEFEKSKKPMVIFVDELDRCRPDYSISLLERIKHFFNVQNIIFILGIDKEALSNSIRVIYGEQTDINGYLTRFIDLEYKLKDGNSEKYIKYLLEKYKFNDIFDVRKSNFREVASVEKDIYDFANTLIYIMVGFGLSLRDIEKLIVQLYMILKVNERRYIYTYQLVLMLIIKRVNKELYIRIKSNKISYEQILQELQNYNVDTAKWVEEEKSSIIKAYLIWFVNDIGEINILNENIEKLEESERYKHKDKRCLESYDWIVKNSGYWYGREGNEIKKKVYEMVELYENFNVISN